jgi:hypothetical protein
VSQNAVFLGAYLFIAIQFYSYYPLYFYLNLIETLFFLFIFYVEWTSQDNNVERKKANDQPISTNFLIVSFLLNIGSSILTILSFYISSTETAIIEGILSNGTIPYLINGVILSAFLPLFLKNRLS